MVQTGYHHTKRNMLWVSSCTAQQEESLKRPQERSTKNGKTHSTETEEYPKIKAYAAKENEESDNL